MNTTTHHTGHRIYQMPAARHAARAWAPYAGRAGRAHTATEEGGSARALARRGRGCDERREVSGHLPRQVSVTTREKTEESL